jgi:hypothetical protein
MPQKCRGLRPDRVAVKRQPICCPHDLTRQQQHHNTCTCLMLLWSAAANNTSVSDQQPCTSRHPHPQPVRSTSAPHACAPSHRSPAVCNGPSIPRKPAVCCLRPAIQPQPLNLAEGHHLVNIPAWADSSRHAHTAARGRVIALAPLLLLPLEPGSSPHQSTEQKQLLEHLQARCARWTLDTHHTRRPAKEPAQLTRGC